MALSIYISPEDGGYIPVNNKFTYISDGINQLNMALLQPVGSWIYGSNDLGNPLLALQGIATIEDVKRAVAYCANPIIESGALISVEVKSYTLNAIKRANIELLATCPEVGEVTLYWSK